MYDTYILYTVHTIHILSYQYALHTPNFMYRYTSKAIPVVEVEGLKIKLGAIEYEVQYGLALLTTVYTTTTHYTPYTIHPALYTSSSYSIHHTPCNYFIHYRTPGVEAKPHHHHEQGGVHRCMAFREQARRYASLQAMGIFQCHRGIIAAWRGNE
ncbi:hypothetical protein EON63_23645 [archaeon]|nr:MAG: hypothetical protein EON63_23645 [archaeon]